MKIMARIFILLTGVLLLAHYLPSGFWLIAGKPQRMPYVFYSALEKRFLFFRYGNGNGEMQRTDSDGKIYDRDEFEELLPLDNYIQLIRDGRMPGTINGIAIPVEKLRSARISFRVKPELLDSPAVALYPLFEAESGRVRLEMPGDVFRLHRAIEFLDVKSNRIITDKSAKFQRAFAAVGFSFPPKIVSGNPSMMKPYDEGYYITDSQDAIFHLRQVHGEPELKRVSEVVSNAEKSRWRAVKPRFIQVQEQENRELRAAIVGEDGRVHLVIGENYQLVTLPLNHYDPTQMQLSVRGDLLNRLVTVASDHYLEAVVLNRDYAFVDRYVESRPERKDQPVGRFASLVFPFTLEFEEDSSGFIGFYFSPGRPLALVVNAALLAPALGWLLLRKQGVMTRLPELVAVILTGVFGLAMFFLVPKSG
jgi:hypothetical protein